MFCQLRFRLMELILGQSGVKLRSQSRLEERICFFVLELALIDNSLVKPDEGLVLSRLQIGLLDPQHHRPADGLSVPFSRLLEKTRRIGCMLDPAEIETILTDSGGSRPDL